MKNGKFGAFCQITYRHSDYIVKLQTVSEQLGGGLTINPMSEYFFITLNNFKPGFGIPILLGYYIFIR